MADDDKLVPRQPDSVSLAKDQDPDAVAQEMFQLLQTATGFMQLQNLDGARQVETRAQALYALAQMGAQPTDLLELWAMKQLIALFALITKVLILQIEGRFSKALEEIPAALDMCSEGISKLTPHAASPERDPTVVESLYPLFTIFPILLKGLEATIRAECFGYRGRIPEYRARLRQAVAEYRRVRELPTSDNPLFVILSSFCLGFADKLDTRSEFFDPPIIDPPRRPTVFIGSSTHGIRVAEQIQLGLVHAAECALWSQGVFGLSHGTLESLVSACAKYDYAILILTPDDLTTKRGIKGNSPRDNVVFELGLFMGALGREKVFMVSCRDESLDLPTDLAGVTLATYDKPVNINLEAALGPVCTRLKQAMAINQNSSPE